jgi:hypothetical protein
MAYYQVDVIVEGALDDSFEFSKETQVRTLAKNLGVQCAHDGLATEMYVLYHSHAPTALECHCIQDAQDHHPEYSWNMEES